MIDEKLKIQNRITLLESRPNKDNGEIVKKLKRKLRRLEEKN